jgi:photosystem II stability/assembly factor-like uncharacterized protein
VYIDFQSLLLPLQFSEMNPALMLAAAAALSILAVENSHTTESLRGVSVVDRQVAWASGTHGTYLRTIDGGHIWASAQVPDATNLDFRAVAAFSADEAFLMSIGTGDQSRVYHTTDAGHHWALQYTNNNPKGFFDSMVFWDPTHGVLVGDPVPDGSGKLKFELLLTDDGQSWHTVPPAQLPEAVPGEGAFAASNTCLAVLPSHSVIPGGAAGEAKPEQPRSRRIPNPIAAPDPNIWFATGGPVARVFHSPDRGKTWQVFDTPILHGKDSAGIFSIAFRDALHGVIAGGDYKQPNADGPNLAFTEDGGQTWTLSPIRPQVFFSSASYDATNKLYIAAQDFVLNIDSKKASHRLTANNPELKFNAISAYPKGGALIVGAKGAIATEP